MAQSDIDAAAAFLKVIGVRTLGVIDPRKDHAAPLCATPTDTSGVKTWLEKYIGKQNLYFTINPSKSSMNRKPAEHEIEQFEYAHVDCDPLPGESAEAARKRHREALKALPYPPTLLWDTGNGVAAAWRIKKPVKLTDSTAIASCKAINLGLIDALGGKAKGVDHCQNLDRLLRIPYTLNIPDRRKRAAGRKEEMAGNVKHHPDHVYDVNDLPRRNGRNPDNVRSIPEIGAPQPTLDLETLDVPERIKIIIKQGKIPGKTKKDDSRSAWECEAVCTMIRAGVADEIILGILTDGQYGISERVLERPNPEQYARKEIIRLRNRIDAAILDDFPESNETSDVLDDLVERTRLDPTAPFASNALKALAALPPDRWEAMRGELKRAGFGRITSLQAAMGKAQDGRKKMGIADRLFSIAQEDADYFQGNDGIAYAHVLVGAVRQTQAVKSHAFRKWLTKRYHDTTGHVPGKTVLEDAIRAIEATADGSPQRRVFVRVGGNDDHVFIDLGNDRWEVVEIDEDGWRVITSEQLPEDVNFKRSVGMLPLPYPAAGGSIQELRPFLNIEQDGAAPSIHDSHFVLAVMWLVGCCRADIPYPILPIAGEHGSAKTTTCELLRMLIDPALPMAKTLPRDERDLYIAANSSHILSFDNVSFLHDWLSDALCRVATGGGFGTRALYTDDEQRLFQAMRPIIINGITSVVWRPDLVDRSIFVGLQPIKERRPRNELMAAFAAAQPRILGAFYDIIAHGLKNLPLIEDSPDMPRMADFDLFARACETKVWKAGTFRRVYTINRSEAKERILKADAVAEALMIHMALETEWQGTATELLQQLDEIAGEHGLYEKKWPASPDHLSRRLRIIAPDMRAARRIDIQFGRAGNEKRTRELRIMAFSDT